METRAIRKEMLVPEDGIVHLEGLTPGDRFEVILLQLSPPAEPETLRRGGWARGLVVIHDDFDDPLPEMEPYM